jgi:hypothetical protein
VGISSSSSDVSGCGSSRGLVLVNGASNESVGSPILLYQVIYLFFVCVKVPGSKSGVIIKDIIDKRNKKRKLFWTDFGFYVLLSNNDRTDEND